MVIPFSDKDFSLSSTQVESTSNTLSPFTPVEIPISDANSINLEIDGDSQFSPEENGIYNVGAVVDIQVDVVGTVVIQLFAENDDIVFSGDYGSIGAKKAILNIDGTIYNNIASKQTRVKIYNATPSGVAFVTGGELQFKRVKQNIQSGTEIDLAGTLPPIKQSDFMKYIFFTFGIIPQTNNKNNSVSLDLFKSVKKNINIADDWSDKVDNSRKSTIDYTKALKKYGTKSLMVYVNDESDEFLARYELENGMVYGSGSMDIANEFIKETKTIYTAPFSPMKNVYRFSLAIGSETGRVAMPNIPFYTENEGVFERTITPKPRIGILTKNIPIEDYVGYAGVDTFWELNINENGGAGTRTVLEMPFCYFVKPFINEAIDSYNDSLAYGLPDELGIMGNDIKTQYLLDQESSISNMRYAKKYILLNEVDISNLDFSIPKYISSEKAYFYVSKITNYRGSKETTLCELVKIV